MIKTVFRCLVAAIIITLLHFITINLFYYRYNAQTMFHDFHYYAWVQYVEGTVLMFVAVFIFEIIRHLLRKR